MSAILCTTATRAAGCINKNDTYTINCNYCYNYCGHYYNERLDDRLAVGSPPSGWMTAELLLLLLLPPPPLLLPLPLLLLFVCTVFCLRWANKLLESRRRRQTSFEALLADPRLSLLHRRLLLTRLELEGLGLARACQT